MQRGSRQWVTIEIKCSHEVVGEVVGAHEICVCCYMDYTHTLPHCIAASFLNPSRHGSMRYTDRRGETKTGNLHVLLFLLSTIHLPHSSPDSSKSSMLIQSQHYICSSFSFVGLSILPLLISSLPPLASLLLTRMR